MDYGRYADSRDDRRLSRDEDFRSRRGFSRGRRSFSPDPKYRGSRVGRKERDSYDSRSPSYSKSPQFRGYDYAGKSKQRPRRGDWSPDSNRSTGKSPDWKKDEESPRGETVTFDFASNLFQELLKATGAAPGPSENVLPDRTSSSRRERRSGSRDRYSRGNRKRASEDRESEYRGRYKRSRNGNSRGRRQERHPTHRRSDSNSSHSSTSGDRRRRRGRRGSSSSSSSSNSSSWEHSHSNRKRLEHLEKQFNERRSSGSGQRRQPSPDRGAMVSDGYSDISSIADMERSSAKLTEEQFREEMYRRLRSELTADRDPVEREERIARHIREMAKVSPTLFRNFMANNAENLSALALMQSESPDHPQRQEEDVIILDSPTDSPDLAGRQAALKPQASRGGLTSPEPESALEKVIQSLRKGKGKKTRPYDGQSSTASDYTKNQETFQAKKHPLDMFEDATSPAQKQQSSKNLFPSAFASFEEKEKQYELWRASVFDKYTSPSSIESRPALGQKWQSLHNVPQSAPETVQGISVLVGNTSESNSYQQPVQRQLITVTPDTSQDNQEVQSSSRIRPSVLMSGRGKSAANQDTGSGHKKHQLPMASSKQTSTSASITSANKRKHSSPSPQQTSTSASITSANKRKHSSPSPQQSKNWKRSEVARDAPTSKKTTVTTTKSQDKKSRDKYDSQGTKKEVVKPSTSKKEDLSSVKATEASTIAQQLLEKHRQITALQKEVDALQMIERDCLHTLGRGNERQNDRVLLEIRHCQKELLKRIVCVRSGKDVPLHPVVSSFKSRLGKGSKAWKERDDWFSCCCKLCQVVCHKEDEFLTHLFSEKHEKFISSSSRPWQKEGMKKYTKEVTKTFSTGEEFLEPTAAFFCFLCYELCCDKQVAVAHLRSEDHHQKYKDFLSNHPAYGDFIMSERAKVLCKASANKITNAKASWGWEGSEKRKQQEDKGSREDGDEKKKDEDRISRDSEKSNRKERDRGSRGGERRSRDQDRSSKDGERCSRDQEKRVKDRSDKDRRSRDRERSSRDREKSSRDREKCSRERDRKATEKQEEESHPREERRKEDKTKAGEDVQPYDSSGGKTPKAKKPSPEGFLSWRELINRQMAMMSENASNQPEAETLSKDSEGDNEEKGNSSGADEKEGKADPKKQKHSILASTRSIPKATTQKRVLSTRPPPEPVLEVPTKPEPMNQKNVPTELKPMHLENVAKIRSDKKPDLRWLYKPPVTETDSKSLSTSVSETGMAVESTPVLSNSPDVSVPPVGFVPPMSETTGLSPLVTPMASTELDAMMMPPPVPMTISAAANPPLPPPIPKDPPPTPPLPSESPNENIEESAPCGINVEKSQPPGASAKESTSPGVNPEHQGDSADESVALTVSVEESSAAGDSNTPPGTATEESATSGVSAEELAAHAVNPEEFTALEFITDKSAPTKISTDESTALALNSEECATSEIGTESAAPKVDAEETEDTSKCASFADDDDQFSMGSASPAYGCGETSDSELSDENDELSASAGASFPERPVTDHFEERAEFTHAPHRETSIPELSLEKTDPESVRQGFELAEDDLARHLEDSTEPDNYNCESVAAPSGESGMAPPGQTTELVFACGEGKPDNAREASEHSEPSMEAELSVDEKVEGSLDEDKSNAGNISFENDGNTSFEDVAVLSLDEGVERGKGAHEATEKPCEGVIDIADPSVQESAEAGALESVWQLPSPCEEDRHEEPQDMTVEPVTRESDQNESSVKEALLVCREETQVSTSTGPEGLPFEETEVSVPVSKETHEADTGQSAQSEEFDISCSYPEAVQVSSTDASEVTHPHYEVSVERKEEHNTSLQSSLSTDAEKCEETSLLGQGTCEESEDASHTPLLQTPSSTVTGNKCPPAGDHQLEQDMPSSPPPNVPLPPVHVGAASSPQVCVVDEGSVEEHGNKFVDTSEVLGLGEKSDSEQAGISSALAGDPESADQELAVDAEQETSSPCVDPSPMSSPSPASPMKKCSPTAQRGRRRKKYQSSGASASMAAELAASEEVLVVTTEQVSSQMTTRRKTRSNTSLQMQCEESQDTVNEGSPELHVEMKLLSPSAVQLGDGGDEAGCVEVEPEDEHIASETPVDAPLELLSEVATEVSNEMSSPSRRRSRRSKVMTTGPETSPKANKGRRGRGRGRGSARRSGGNLRSEVMETSSSTATGSQGEGEEAEGAAADV